MMKEGWRKVERPDIFIFYVILLENPTQNSIGVLWCCHTSCKWICQTWGTSEPLVRVGCLMALLECKIRQRPVELWKLPGLGDRNKCWVSVVSVCHQRKAHMCQRGELRTGAGDAWPVAMCSGRYRSYNTRQLNEGSAQQQKEKGLLCRNRRIRPHPAANGPTVKTSSWFSTGTEETRLQGCSCISKWNSPGVGLQPWGQWQGVACTHTTSLPLLPFPQSTLPSGNGFWQVLFLNLPVRLLADILITLEQCMP